MRVRLSPLAAGSRCSWSARRGAGAARRAGPPGVCPGLLLAYSCGNKTCEPGLSENATNCPQDCLAAPLKSYNNLKACTDVDAVRTASSAAQIQQFVRDAAAAGQQVKASGNRHSDHRRHLHQRRRDQVEPGADLRHRDVRGRGGRARRRRREDRRPGRVAARARQVARLRADGLPAADGRRRGRHRLARQLAALRRGARQPRALDRAGRLARRSAHLLEGHDCPRPPGARSPPTPACSAWSRSCASRSSRSSTCACASPTTTRRRSSAPAARSRGGRLRLRHDQLVPAHEEVGEDLRHGDDRRRRRRRRERDAEPGARLRRRRRHRAQRLAERGLRPRLRGDRRGHPVQRTCSSRRRSRRTASAAAPRCARPTSSATRTA